MTEAELLIVARARDEATATMRQVEGGLGGMLKNVASLAMGFGAAQMGMNLLSSGMDMVKGAIIGMNASLEKSTLQFETLMGDSDRAKEHVANLFEFAKKTPFETEPIIKASRLLQTFGGDALNTMDNLTRFGDAAAGASADIGEVSFWVGRAYSAIKGGQPFGEAAMRLQELALMTPETRQEMERLQKTGASMDQVWGLLTKDLDRFGGAMQKQAGTWEGLTSTLKDTIAIISAKTLKPVFDMLKGGLEGLIGILSSPALEEGAKLIGDVLVGAFSFLGDKLKELRPLLDLLSEGFGVVVEGVSLATPFFLALGDALSRILSGQADWGSFTQVLKDFFGPEAQAMGEAFIGTIQTISRTIGDLLGKLGELVGPLETTRPILIGLGAMVAAIVVPAFVAWAASATAAAAATIAAIAAVSWPLIAVGAVVAGLAMIWINNMGDIQGKTEAVMQFIGGLLGAAGRAWEDLGTTLGRVGTDIGRTWDSIKTAMESAWEGIKSAFSLALAALVSGVQGWISSLLLPFQQAWDGVSTAFSTWWASDKGLPGALKVGLTALVTAVSEWIESFKLPFTNAWTGVTSIFTAYIGEAGSILGALGTGLTALVTAVTGWIELFKAEFQKAWDGVTTIFDTLLGSGGAAGGNLWNTLGTGLTTLVTVVQNWIELFLQPYRDAWDDVTTLFEDVWEDYLKPALSAGLQELVDLAISWKDTFLRPFQEAWEGITQLFDWIIGKSELPDMLAAGLDEMTAMAWDWAGGFARPFDVVMDEIKRIWAGGVGSVGGLGIPSGAFPTPKVPTEEEAMAAIFAKDPNLQKMAKESGRTPEEMVKEWWSWGASVREGTKSLVEYAQKKGLVPTVGKAGPDIRISAPMRRLEDLYEQLRPYSTSMTEAAAEAVNIVARDIEKASEGLVKPSTADLEKWLESLLSNIINQGLAGPTTPTAPAPRPVPAPAPSTAGPRTAAQTVNISLTGTFLASNRSMLQELARLLKPELDKLVAISVG